MADCACGSIQTAAEQWPGHIASIVLVVLTGDWAVLVASLCAVCLLPFLHKCSMFVFCKAREAAERLWLHDVSSHHVELLDAANIFTV